VAGASHHHLLRVVKPDGGVAIFWHTFPDGRDSFYDRLDDIYRDHAPDLYVTDLHAKAEMADREREEQILAWDGFTDRRTIRYHDHLRHSAEGYLALLRT
jgi:hypothetical protein